MKTTHGKSRSTTRVAVAVAAFGIFLAAARAGAVDGKIYPGHNCSAVQLNATTTTGGHGQITAPATTIIECNIATDNETNTAGTASAVVSLNKGPTDYSNCILLAMASDDTITNSTIAFAFSAGQQNLNVSVPSSAVNGHYLLNCRLSAGSTLYQYSIEEN